MNWLVTFRDHEEDWMPAVAIVSDEESFSSAVAMVRAAKKLRPIIELSGYRRVTIEQVIA